MKNARRYLNDGLLELSAVGDSQSPTLPIRAEELREDGTVISGKVLLDAGTTVRLLRSDKESFMDLCIPINWQQFGSLLRLFSER